MRKRFFGIMTAAVLAAASVPAYTASAADQSGTKRFEDGTFYESWNANFAGSFDVQEQPEGGITMTWDQTTENLVRYGIENSGKKSVSELDGVEIAYDAEIEGTGIYYVMAGAYSQNPQREFYVVEGWNGWRPPGEANLVKTAEINGVKYDIYRTKRDDYSNLTHNTYPVFWSVRQDNLCKAGEKSHLTGTIQLDAHFRVWDTADNGIALNAPIKEFFMEADSFGGDKKEASGVCKLAKPEIRFTEAQTDPAEESLRSHQNRDFSFTENGTGMMSYIGPFFRIGGSISSFRAADKYYTDFYEKNFNSVTCESDMLPSQIIKEIDGTNVTVDLQKADAALKFAEAHGIGVRGKTFITGSFTPGEMFQGTPEESDQRIENFIKETFSQLKTNYPKLKLYAYDVATDVLKSEGGGLRTANSSIGDASRWAHVYGDDNPAFIINAFKAARQYAPSDCKLFLNENNEYIPEKCEDICKLAKKIMAEGDYIDGIGMQSHLDAAYPDAETYETAFKKFAALGLDIQITELDITNTQNCDEKAWTNLWKDVFRIAYTYPDNITSITLWEPVDSALDDDKSLFHNASSPKDVYYDVIFKTWGSELPPAVTTEPAAEPNRGDANCDGSVDVADAVLVLRYVSEDETANITDQGVKNGAADQNGRTDDKDASLILQFIARKITF